MDRTQQAVDLESSSVRNVEETTLASSYFTEMIRKGNEDSVHIATKFENDCGPFLSKPILSTRMAMANAAICHPGTINEDGISYTPHKITSPFGWHDFPFRQLFCSKSPGHGIIDKYGMGVVLWFKLLKAFVIIYFVLFFISLISLGFFWNGDAASSAENDLKFSSSPEHILAASTFGNLGEPYSFCFDVNQGNTVEINCGKGQIRSIIAYYGHPSGSCSCPLNQLPRGSTSTSSSTSSLTCPASPITLPTGQSVCPDGIDKACFPTYIQHKYPSYKQPCCAYKQNSYGQPDLDINMRIAPNYSCNSLTSQYIAEGLCLGQSSCKLTADTNVFLGAIGSWKTCPLDSETELDKNLIIQGVCFQNTLDVWGKWTISKKLAVLISAAVNAFAMLVFLLALIWIRLQQKKEIHEDKMKTCRVSDYTVCPSIIPAQEDHKQLRRELISHLEDTLNQTWPVVIPGDVHVVDVNFFTGTPNYLAAASRRAKIANLLDDVRTQHVALLKLGRRGGISLSMLKIRKSMLENEFKQMDRICQYLWTQTASKQIKRLYITFESEEGMQRCLRACGTPPPASQWSAFWRSICVCVSSGSSSSSNTQISDVSALTYVPAEDPEDTLFEYTGVHVLTLTWRRTITTILWFACFCGALITYEKTLRDYNWNAYNNYNNNSNSINGDLGYLKCFCLEQYKRKDLNSMKNYDFFNILTGKNEKWCNNIIRETYHIGLLRVAIAGSIVFASIFVSTLFSYIGEFEMFARISTMQLSFIIRTFILQFVIIALMILGIFGNPPFVKVPPHYQDIITLFEEDYSDFSTDWYFNIGVIIIIAVIMFSIAIHIWKVLGAIYIKFCQWADTKQTKAYTDPMKTFRGLPDYYDAIPTHVMKLRTEERGCRLSILNRYKEKILETESSAASSSPSSIENGLVKSETAAHIQMSGLESYDVNVMDRYINKYGLNSSRMREINPPDLSSDDFTGRAFLANRIGPWDSQARVTSFEAEALPWSRRSISTAISLQRNIHMAQQTPKDLLAETLEIARLNLRTLQTTTAATAAATNSNNNHNSNHNNNNSIPSQHDTNNRAIPPLHSASMSIPFSANPVMIQIPRRPSTERITSTVNIATVPNTQTQSFTQSQSQGAPISSNGNASSSASSYPTSLEDRIAWSPNSEVSHTKLSQSQSQSQSQQIQETRSTSSASASASSTPSRAGPIIRPSIGFFADRTADRSLKKLLDDDKGGGGGSGSGSGSGSFSVSNNNRISRFSVNLTEEKTTGITNDKNTGATITIANNNNNNNIGKSPGKVFWKGSSGGSGEKILEDDGLDREVVVKNKNENRNIDMVATTKKHKSENRILDLLEDDEESDDGDRDGIGISIGDRGGGGSGGGSERDIVTALKGDKRQPTNNEGILLKLIGIDEMQTHGPYI
eukprot:gene6254-12660_t